MFLLRLTLIFVMVNVALVFAESVTRDVQVDNGSNSRITRGFIKSLRKAGLRGATRVINTGSIL